MVNAKSSSEGSNTKRRLNTNNTTDDQHSTKKDVKRANTNTTPKLLPVTLLSGFLGAGKTTLLKRILQSKQSNFRVAIIVNDMGAINLDAEEIKKHKLIQEKQEMIEMHNGCICCTLRGDLLKTVKLLAMEEKYDYLVIESTGISEPLPVAQTFVMDASETNDDHDDGEEDQDDNGDESNIKTNVEPLSKYAKMDTLVTVIDAYNFASILGTVESEADRKKYFGSSDDVDDTEESEESIVQLLIDQIEFANVILLNKVDLLSDSEKSSSIDHIKAVLQKLNPKATIIVPDKPKFEEFDANKIINTNLFDMEEAQESAGWLAELAKPVHTPETEEYGVGSFVYRNDDRPFHPERMANIMNNFGTSLVKNIVGKEAAAAAAAAAATATADKSGGNIDDDVFSSVIRCKGEVWLSNADACPIEIHSVGRQLVLEPAGRPWIRKVIDTYPHGDPEGKNPNDDDCEVWDSLDINSQTLTEFKEGGKWNTHFGDRRSGIVFIGIKLNESKIRQALNDALLTDEELAVDKSDRKKVWADDLKDSFFDDMPLWDLEDIMGVEEDGDECM